jgi:hypothetical protein
VTTALPAALWAIVLVGALLTIELTYLFTVKSSVLHTLLVGILATFIGLLVFLTTSMDNPLRGEFSVSPDAFEMVLQKDMRPKPSVGAGLGPREVP